MAWQVLRNRVSLLIEKHRCDTMNSLRKSGTTEDYSSIQITLEDIVTQIDDYRNQKSDERLKGKKRTRFACKWSYD